MSRSNRCLNMEVERLLAEEEEEEVQEEDKKKVMRTDKLSFRVCAGPTHEVDKSTDLYLHGGAPPAAHTAISAPTPTTPAVAPPPPTSTPLSEPAAAAFPAPFKSPGMAAAATAGATFRFPGFTTAQWQELERQAMIYKYMMASVPIPPDLLLPFKSSFRDSSSTALGRSGGSTFHLRFSNSVDPEPGRCRRTDGKKWRCSRDVAPDQKYCERHMHRGRPRSRKHVEAQAQAQAQSQSQEALSPAKSKARTIPPNTATATTTTSSRNPALQSLPAAQPSFLAAKNPFFAEVEEQPRYVDWMNGAGSGNGHVWQLMEQGVGARMRPCYEDGLNFNFSGFGGHEQSQQYIFFNSDLASLEDPLHKDPPLHFIDAWSMRAGEPTAVSDAGVEADKFPIMSSSLTLSMPSCEDEEQAVRMGLGVAESGRESINGGSRPTLGWANSSLPLLGGPLGEVLQSTSASSNTLSPHSCGGLNLMVEPSVEGCTTTTTTTTGRDSPSGVLHRTLASLSDSSGCSSPTFAACQFAFLS